jgi:three-Cys-motif partner protein
MRLSPTIQRVFRTSLPCRNAPPLGYGNVALTSLSRREEVSAVVVQSPIASDGLTARESGAWVLDKKVLVEKCLGIFTTGVGKKRGGKLAYVDLFSGPGKNAIRDTEEEIDGSPLLALRYGFGHYVFVDKPEILSTLRMRLSNHPKMSLISFVEGDCNLVIDEVLRQLPADHLTLAFIDPTGLQIRFETIRRLVDNRKVDLLMTIQFGMGILMNLHQHFNSEGEALTGFLGNTDWRQDVEQAGTASQAGRRILDRYLAQLRALDYLDTEDLEIVRNDQNMLLYFIIMASRHALGKKFWGEVTKIAPSGQRRFLFGQ